MKNVIRAALVIISLGCASFAQDPGWLVQQTSALGRLVYYQPQVDDWTDYETWTFGRRSRFDTEWWQGGC